MVSVRGQIEAAPLLDIISVRQEYWTKKQVLLPSLKEFQPVQEKQGRWVRFKAFCGLRSESRPVPKIVLQRLSEEQWRSINERFHTLKENLAREQATLLKILNRMAEGKSIKKKERLAVSRSHEQAMPIYISMLEEMIIEPDLDYAGVRLLLDAVDDRDRETLMSFVNMMTSEKAGAAKKVYEQRLQEMDGIKAEVMASQL
tara:strand:- start:232 stop:834 length:603 start_codon:yes stop_codon:yes gene_type:complete